MQQYEEMNPYQKATIDHIRQMLGEEADYLLQHRSEKIPKESLYLPGPDFIERVMMDSDRPTQVLRNLKSLMTTQLSKSPPNLKILD